MSTGDWDLFWSPFQFGMSPVNAVFWAQIGLSLLHPLTIHVHKSDINRFNSESKLILQQLHRAGSSRVILFTNRVESVQQTSALEQAQFGKIEKQCVLNEDLHGLSGWLITSGAWRLRG